MMSVIAVRSGAFSALLKQTPRVLAVVPASRPMSKTTTERVHDWDEANKIFYGPERDTKNFPHPVQPAVSGKCRMGFLPEEWFQFFYQKTGVTGPYLFGVGLVTTLISKEIWVIDHGFAEVIGFYGAVWFLTKTVGASFAKWMDTRNDALYKESFVKPLEDSKKRADNIIQKGEEAIWREEGQRHLWEAKKENVALQLEEEYRRRLHMMYKEVKARMDYMLEVEFVKRRFEQDHMVNWLVAQVKKGITPQQEAASIKDCIAQLKKMAAEQRAKLGDAPAPAPAAAQ